MENTFQNLQLSQLCRLFLLHLLTIFHLQNCQKIAFASRPQEWHTYKLSTIVYKDIAITVAKTLL